MPCMRTYSSQLESELPDSESEELSPYRHIDTHAFSLYLAWYRLHMSATSGLDNFLFVVVSANNLNIDGCVLQVDQLLAIENIFSELPSYVRSCGKWLAHWRNGWSARGEPIRSHCERTKMKNQGVPRILTHFLWIGFPINIFWTHKNWPRINTWESYCRGRTTLHVSYMHYTYTFELFRIIRIIRPPGNGKYRITAVLLGLPVIPNTNIRTKWLFYSLFEYYSTCIRELPCPWRKPLCHVGTPKLKREIWKPIYSAPPPSLATTSLLVVAALARRLALPYRPQPTRPTHHQPCHLTMRLGLGVFRASADVAAQRVMTLLRGSHGSTVGERSIEKELSFASKCASNWELKVWMSCFCRHGTSDFIVLNV